MIKDHDCPKAYTTRNIGGKLIVNNYIDLRMNEPKVRNKQYIISEAILFKIGVSLYQSIETFPPKKSETGISRCVTLGTRPRLSALPKKIKTRVGLV